MLAFLITASLITHDATPPVAATAEVAHTAEPGPSHRADAAGLLELRDPTEAIRLYRRACDAGDWLGCENLIQSVLQDRYPRYARPGARDIKPDPWFRRESADEAPPPADDGDYRAALAVLANQCAKDEGIGSALSCSTLAGATFVGIGGVVDWEKSRSLLRQACSLGDDRGCLDLAVVTEQGLGGPPDPRAARAAHRRGVALARDGRVVRSPDGHEGRAHP